MQLTALVKRIGSGGTGIVYKATDLTLGETIAIKMLTAPQIATISLPMASR